MKYILAIDQSTQGTKAMLVDSEGSFVLRRDIPHEQRISSRGWVGHNMKEIAENIIKVSRMVIEDSKIDRADVAAVAVTNQRETVGLWDRATGEPVYDAVVWQCNRADELCRKIYTPEIAEDVLNKTGLHFSPYFSAPKAAWILENIPGARERAEKGELCFGTMDTWTIWTLTGGQSHKTDCSNASRTQVFNINTMAWDEELCRLFKLPMSMLPEVCQSDALFGETDLDGFLPRKVPVHSAIGDSNAVLFCHGCTDAGDAMCGYGTGSSVQFNIGSKPVISGKGVNTTVAWSRKGKPVYALEGVVNYSGAVVTWLKDNAGLIMSPSETSELAYSASSEDRTYMVPAFTGIGAPHWKSDATAAYVGMTRVTGRAELVRAAIESVAYQIADLVLASAEEVSTSVRELRVAGGPSKNPYMMQFQSDILGCPVKVSEHEEMSGIGSAYICGESLGMFNAREVIEKQTGKVYLPLMSGEVRAEKLKGWQHALETVFSY